ncbi:MAG: MOSC domain-containing protein [Thermoanaerobaculia bacterium]|nr:MOSC domain-containing protein [Thermoanaerobaculia bacterium]
MPDPTVIGRVVSVHAGALRTLLHAGRELASGIFKTVLAGGAPVGVAGLEGDCQGDSHHHGGPGRALCVYPREHLVWLAGRVGEELGTAPCGENLSTESLLEPDHAIGDCCWIGSAIFEISAPRNPCHRLAARHGVPDLPVDLERSGRTSLFFRVLAPGWFTAGDEVVRLEQPFP